MQTLRFDVLHATIFSLTIWEGKKKFHVYMQLWYDFSAYEAGFRGAAHL